MLPGRRSRRLRLCLLVGLVSASAAVLLGLGGLDVALLDLAPFVLLAALTLVWPEASARLIGAVRRRRPRRPSAPLAWGCRRPRDERHAGVAAPSGLGARAPPRSLLGTA